eukprot:2986542-Amphidinium_carterae.1
MADFVLVDDHATNTQLLYQSHTDQHVRLGAAGHALRKTVEGHAYLATTTGSTWCCDYFKDQVVLQPTGEVLVVNPDSAESRTLVQYRQAHCPCSYGVQFIGVGSAQEVDIFLLSHEHSGCNVLYDLPSLYKLVLGASATMTPARWYFSWWPHWEKMLALHRVPNVHLRKAAVVGEKAAQALDDDVRFLKVPTVSTHVLLLLLSRWGSESKSSKKKSDTARQSWKVCLMSLLKRWFPQGSQTVLHISSDTAAIAAPGYPVQGNNFIEVQIEGDELLWEPFIAADTQASSLVRVLENVAPRMKLCDLLWSLDAAGRKMQWLYDQVVLVLASTMERNLIRERERSSEMASGAPTCVALEEILQSVQCGRRQRKYDKQRLRLQTKAAAMDGTARSAIQYVMAMRKTFANAQVLHFAWDASRVGGKGRLLGALTRCTGVAAWLPPQVPLCNAFSPLSLCPIHKEFLAWGA